MIIFQFFMYSIHDMIITTRSQNYEDCVYAGSTSLKSQIFQKSYKYVFLLIKNFTCQIRAYLLKSKEAEGKK